MTFLAWSRDRQYFQTLELRHPSVLNPFAISHKRAKKKKKYTHTYTRTQRTVAVESPLERVWKPFRSSRGPLEFHAGCGNTNDNHSLEKPTAAATRKVWRTTLRFERKSRDVPAIISNLRILRVVESKRTREANERPRSEPGSANRHNFDGGRIPDH